MTRPDSDSEALVAELLLATARTASDGEISVDLATAFPDVYGEEEYWWRWRWYLAGIRPVQVDVGG